ncbi:hypothetical protein [Sporomusa termitida]|uniref:Outer membrane protein (OmpH-like) n=1 Tax=Sporomusa termitida TaxID=2377 RepID=A0A517DXI6_9FIRM|nr:hypothetical protein [Sporomusa termitida]QDR82079.1 hypothetical protein SPTER_35000 [Sporomusa termitida]
MKLTTPIRFLATLIFGAVLLTGCARPAPETPPPVTPQVGVIDMDKAVKAHAKHPEWQKLNEQAATLQQQLAAEAGRAAGASPQMPAMQLPAAAASGLQAAAEQEFNAKMTAKQQELQARLAEKAGKLHNELAAELRTYAEQLEQEYQPQQFNLQLKLQTIRMNEQEAAATKQKLDELKAEQAGKLAAREQELSQKLEAALTPEKAASEQELAAYAKQLSAEINQKIAAQTSNLADQIPGAMSQPSAAGVSALEQQLALKQQEMSVLQQSILNDIREKAAKVASEDNLDVVFTGHRVNVSAVDITDAVIAAVKK